jgi:hypothetical protein
MFAVTFVAVDYAGVSTTAVRSVIVVARCAPGLNDCGATLGCSSMPCAARVALAAPSDARVGADAEPFVDPGPPVLTLVGGATLVDVPYGGSVATPNAAYSPCGKATETSGCGAVATDARPGLTPLDLSARIVVREVTAGHLVTAFGGCSAELAGNGGCAPCGITAAAAGMCVPGVYVYEYSVTDDDAQTSTATRVIRVSAFARVNASLSFTFPVPFTNKTEAAVAATMMYTPAIVAARLEAVRAAVATVEVRVPLTSNLVKVIKVTVFGTSPPFRRCDVEFTVDVGTFAAVARLVASPPPLSTPPATFTPSGIRLEYVSPPPSPPSPPPPPPSPPPLARTPLPPPPSPPPLRRTLLGALVILNDETGPILDAAAARMQAMVRGLGGLADVSPVALTPQVDHPTSTRSGIEAALESIRSTHAVLRMHLEEAQLNFNLLTADSGPTAAVSRLLKVEAGIVAIADRMSALRSISEPFSSGVGKGLDLELPRLEDVRSALLTSRIAMLERVEAMAAAAAAARGAAEQGACTAAVVIIGVSNVSTAIVGAGPVPAAATDGVLRVEYRLPFTVPSVAALTASELAVARRTAANLGASLDSGVDSILRVVADAPELMSFVGGSNRIVGGVTLILTRKVRAAGCGGKFAKLNAPCFRDVEQTTAPFGVDPVASPFHKLFNADVAAELGAFYDAKGAADVSPELVSKPGTKIPHAFYSEDIPGSPPGYYMFFDTKLPLSRVRDKLLEVLKQGRFLRPDSVESLKMIVVTWNAELQVFGRVEVAFVSDEGGTIQASTKVNVLVDYRITDPTVLVGVVGQVFKGLLVLFFLANTVYEIHRQTARTIGVGIRTGARFRFIKGIFMYYQDDPSHLVDTVVDLLVLVTQSMWWVYVGMYVLPLNQHPAMHSQLSVYDNDAAASARYFLPAKAFNASSVHSNFTAGARWDAPDDPSANGVYELLSFAHRIEQALNPKP